MNKKQLKVGDVVRFAARVYKAPFAPYYDKYKGHRFTVKAFRNRKSHVEVVCVDEPSLLVDGLVHQEELVKV